MTNQEINEYFAEHLFDIVVCDTKPYCKKCKDTSTCKHKGYLTNKEWVVNYIENWQAVVEKVCRNEMVDVVIKRFGKNPTCTIRWQDWKANDDKYSRCKRKYASGNTIGEAVCLAAVEYLKAVHNA